MSNFGTAPTPGPRQYGTPYVVPFQFVGEPRKPHTQGIEAHPALPAIRSAGKGGPDDNRWDDAIVIDMGEPVGVYTDPSTGRKYLVPCTGGGAATVTYTDYDVAQGIEDLDNAGNAVTAAGTTSATLPVVAPIGIAAHPIFRNFQAYTDSAVTGFPTLYANYNPDLKPVVAKSGQFMIPWYRHGAKAIADAEIGKALVAARITNISATNRPFFQTANMVATAAGNATAATATLTVHVDNGLVADETLTISHMGNTYVLTAVANGGTPDINAGEFEIGAANTDTAANIKATLDAIVPSVAFTAAVATNVVTITSAVKGDEGNFTPDIDDTDITNVAAAETDATDADASLNVSHDMTNALNLVYKIGSIHDMRTSLVLDGTYSTMYHTVSTPGLYLSGTKETGGIPATLRVAGNHPTDNVVPTSPEQAGAVIVSFNVNS